MCENDFSHLLSLLQNDIQMKSIPSTGSSKKHRHGAKNGLIHGSTRLSCGLHEERNMISPLYMASVCPRWKVVDAVNSCLELEFEFPCCHGKQKELARGFQALSDANFDTCAAAIDGLLIWMDRSRGDDCDTAGCRPKKFHCMRKHKFGVNMIGTVDSLERFLDVGIRYPGSTSDFLVFTTFNLKDKLEMPGFLGHGLLLFGDNAYMNTSCMVVPFKCAQDSQDDFNFYHSQVRINVECAFGKHRWRIY